MSDWPIRVMVYGAGEAINGGSVLAPSIQGQLARLRQVATNRYIAAIAQVDASNVPTQRFVLDPSGQQPVMQLPDVDTGDPNALISFVGWSAAICPARRSVLVLSGHGAAWEDALVDQVLGIPGNALRRSIDAVPRVPGALHHARRLFGLDVTPHAAAVRAVLVDGDNRDYLSNAELGATCDAIAQQLGGKIDVLVFDACLMSAWEILEEVAGSVSTVVGSIDELSATGIDLAGPVYTLTSAAGAGDAATIAATFARQFQPQASFDSCVAVDLSNPRWPTALSYFRAFCASLLPWVQASQSHADAARAALRYAATSVVRFTSGGLADIGALADAFANVPSAPSDAVSSLRAAATALNACVLGRSTGSDYASAVGISVFSPNSASVYSTNRAQYVRLQLPTVSGWAAVLDALYGFQNSYARFITQPAGPVQEPVETHDDEFLVSLQGFPIDDATRDLIEKAISRAVLVILAGIDMLDDVSISPPDGAVATRSLGLGRLPGLGPTNGLVLVLNEEFLAQTRALVPSTPGAPQPGAPAGQATRRPLNPDGGPWYPPGWTPGDPWPPPGWTPGGSWYPPIGPPGWPPYRPVPPYSDPPYTPIWPPGGFSDPPMEPARRQPPLPLVQSSGSEFRVLLRGLKLDQATRERIGEAIRSAALQIVATLDHTHNPVIASPADDPATRSLLGELGRKILGLILTVPPEV